MRVSKVPHTPKREGPTIRNGSQGPPSFCAPVGGAVARWRLLRVVVHGGFGQVCPFGKWGWGGGYNLLVIPPPAGCPPVCEGGGVGLGGGVGVAGDVADAAS